MSKVDTEYSCPVCKATDETAYMRCNRPDCTDGRDPRPSRPYTYQEPVTRATLSSAPVAGGEEVQPVAWRTSYGGYYHGSRRPNVDPSVALEPLSPTTELDALRKERDNLQARLTARATTMLRFRDALAGVHDHIEDEGDRVYFGSTNDADAFKEVWQELDAWAWDDIMSDGKMDDVFEVSRNAHSRAEAAEARVAEFEEEAAIYLEELIEHTGDSMDDTRQRRIDELRAARRVREGGKVDG